MKKVLTLMLVFALSLTIAGCAKDPEGPTDAENLADAKQKLSLVVADPLSVKANIELPATGLNGSTIVWSSNNETVIANDGTVTRPAIGTEDVVVILTATITVGDESDTKVFQYKVIANVPMLDVTIGEFNSNTVAMDADVVVEGVIFGFVPGNGFQIWDETGFVYVYATEAVIGTLVLGDEVKVTGVKDNYFGLPEVVDVISAEKLSGGNALPTYAVTSTFDLYDEDPLNTDFGSKPMNVTGMVKVTEDYVILVATDEANVPHNIAIYYKSHAAQITALTAMAGKIATVNVIYYGFDDRIPAFRVTVPSDAVPTSVVATDAQVASYEAGQLNLGDLTEVQENLTLPTAGTIAGTTIAWASDDAAVTAAGVVTRAIGSDTTVVLTATVSVGDVDETKTFTVIVKDADYSVVYMTVAEALLEAEETIVVVKGIVTGFDYANRPYIQDAAGKGIYVKDKLTDVKIGDEVIVRGEITIESNDFGDTNWIKIEDATLLDNLSSGNALVIGDLTASQVAEGYLDYYSNVYTVTVKYLETKELGTYGNYYHMFEAYVDASDPVVPANDVPLSLAVEYFPWFLDIFSVGDMVELTIVVSDYNYDSVRVAPASVPTLTDAQNKTIIEDMLSVSESVIDDITLPTSYPEYNTTITWSSNNFAIGNDGSVSRPSNGDGNAVVILTATITVGSLPAFDIEFTVNVLQETIPGTELFFSEYGEPDGGNCKYVEIFNPSDADIDLTGYVFVNGYNGNTWETVAASNKIVLSGTVAAGGTFVVYNSACVDAEDAAQLATNAFPTDAVGFNAGTVNAIGFNGDDALGLFKNDVLIDAIGVNGTDPGSYWPVGNGDLSGGNTKNNIMVRVSTVAEGSTDWAVGAMQWIVSADDKDYSTVGTHTYTYVPAT